MEECKQNINEKNPKDKINNQIAGANNIVVNNNTGAIEIQPPNQEEDNSQSERLERMKLNNKVWDWVNKNAISLPTLFVAVLTCVFMFQIHRLQRNDSNRQIEINAALNNGNMEFIYRNWEDAFQQFSRAITLGSPDRRGFIKFRERADSLYVAKGRYHDEAVEAFWYTEQLYKLLEEWARKR